MAASVWMAFAVDATLTGPGRVVEGVSELGKSVSETSVKGKGPSVYPRVSPIAEI